MTLETVADRRLHPATFVIRAIRALPQYVLGLPAAAGVMSDAGLNSLLLFAAAGLCLSVGGAYLFWKRFRYGLGTGEVVIESGVLHRQRRVIPFDRIQDIDIEQGMLARLFGTAKVRIETGGAARNEGDLDSVALGEAHRLREVLRRGDAAAQPDSQREHRRSAMGEPLLFHMTLGRVLIAGLFNFSLFYLAFIFGGLEYLDALIGIDVLGMDWIGPAKSLVEAATWGLTLLALAVVMAIGIVAGVLRTLSRDYDFRLSRSSTGLRRRRGLFTLSEIVIPFRRIQLALIRSGLVERRFGWHRLEFQTLGTDAAKGGRQVVAPLAREEEVLAILAEVRPQPLPPEEDYHRVSTRHILRQAVRWAIFPALPVLASAFVWPVAWGILFLLVPLAAVAAALQWKHHRYCLTADALHVRQGMLSRRHWILPYERIQAISVDQGPLQRRLGLASVASDTAGASLLRGASIVNLPAAEADAVAHRLLAAHKRARAALRRPAPAG